MVGGSALVRMGHRELRGRRLTTVVGFRLAVNDTLQRAHVSRLTLAPANVSVGDKVKSLLSTDGRVSHNVERAPCDGC